MLETEVKLMLDPSDAPWLFRGCRVLRRVEQLNVYYDHDWKLADLDATLRVRLQPGSDPKLTLKVTQAWSAGQREALEPEVRLTARLRSIVVPRRLELRYLADPVRASLFDLLARKGRLREVYRVGCARTVRHVIALKEGSTFELDQTRYPHGRTDLEVEIEGQPTQRAAIEAFVRTRAPSACPSTMSKYQRFRQAVCG